MVTKHSERTFSVIALLVLALPVCLSNADQSDFRSFYHGASIVGTGKLYDAAAAPSDISPYIRPPFWAFILKPLTVLPISAAFSVWQASNLAAVFLFYLYWTHRGIDDALIIAGFIPLWTALYLGQDTALLLATLATGMLLLEHRRPLIAGLFFSLLSVKPHLFVFVPLALLRFRVALASCLAFGAGWFLLSVMLEGAQWPLKMVEMSIAHDARTRMKLVSVRTLVYASDNTLMYVVIVAVIVFLLAALIKAWALDAKTFLATGVFVGVCLSHHALLYDAALALPLLTIYPPASPLFAVLVAAAATVDQAAVRWGFWFLPPLRLFGIGYTTVGKRLLRSVRSFVH